MYLLKTTRKSYRLSVCLFELWGKLAQIFLCQNESSPGILFLLMPHLQSHTFTDFFSFPGFPDKVSERQVYNIDIFLLSIYSIVRKYGLINIRKLQSMHYLFLWYTTFHEFSGSFILSWFSVWEWNAVKMSFCLFILYSCRTKAVKSWKVCYHDTLFKYNMTFLKRSTRGLTLWFSVTSWHTYMYDFL